MKRFGMGPAILFCPADRPDRFGKALERADAVILDLEDGVGSDRKSVARQALLDHPQDPERTIIRVNPAGTANFAEDLLLLKQTAYRTIMLPKAESREDLENVANYKVVALCESARGVLHAGQIASLPHVVALMWGAEDLVASLGGFSSRTEDGSYRDVAKQARSQVLLAAGAFGKIAIDSVYLDLSDHDGLLAESLDAYASGFGAKASIHPGQMPVIRQGFLPSDTQRQWASRLLDAAETQAGAFAFEGQMVDEPLLRHARVLLDRRE